MGGLQFSTSADFNLHTHLPGRLDPTAMIDRWRKQIDHLVFYIHLSSVVSTFIMTDKRLQHKLQTVTVGLSHHHPPRCCWLLYSAASLCSQVAWSICVSVVSVDPLCLEHL